MKKVFVTLTNKEFLPYVKPLEVCAKEVGKWDGDFVCITEDSEFVKKIPGNPSIHFYKMFLFHEYFNQWDWIFYCDLDVMFLNKINLELKNRQKDILYANDDDLKFHEQFSKLPVELNPVSDYKSFQTCFLLFNKQIIGDDYFSKLYECYLDYFVYRKIAKYSWWDQTIFNSVFIDSWHELGDKFVNRCPVLNEIDWDISKLENGYYDNTDYSDKIAVHFFSFFPPWNENNLKFYPIWKEYNDRF